MRKMMRSLLAVLLSALMGFYSVPLAFAETTANEAALANESASASEIAVESSIYSDGLENEIGDALQSEEAEVSDVAALAAEELVASQDSEVQGAQLASLSGRAHVQNLGWLQEQSSGESEASIELGTSGQALRMEAIVLSVAFPDGVEGGLRYRTHVQDVGWQDWVQDGEQAGTTGMSRRLEAIEVELYGDAASLYDVYYCTHIENYGWLNWASNGERAGSEGLSLRMECVRIVLLPKGEGSPSGSGPALISSTHSSFASGYSAAYEMSVSCGDGSYTINPIEVNGGYSFCLPSSASLTNTSLSITECSHSVVYCGASGVELALGQTCALSNMGLVADSDGEYLLEVFSESDQLLDSIPIMFSQNVDAMLIVSDDPVNQGRSYIESSSDHSAKATGSMILAKEDGTLIYDGALTQIKGRGNSTWRAAKKPYQIKLDKKTDLLESGDSAEKSKTWVLLANAYDSTLSRSAIALDLAQELGVSYAIDYKSIDLYYDGEYRGAYLLCEKVEVGSGRVDIESLEDSNEDINPDIESCSLVTGTNSYGNQIKYSEGAVSPDDITGGYLFELDARYASEPAWFAVTTQYETLYFVCKSPEYWTYDEANYLSCLVQDAFDCLANGGVHPQTGETVSEYFDLDALAALYWVNEWSRNPDGFCFASTFFSKDAGADSLITCGPGWDFDLSMSNNIHSASWDSSSWYTADTTIGKLMFQSEDVMSSIRSIFSDFVAEATSILDNIQSYFDEIFSSQVMDADIWWLSRSDNTEYSRDDAQQSVVEWLTERLEWLVEMTIPASNPTAHISTHVQDVGWVGCDLSGLSGTTGQGLRLEAITASYQPADGSDISGSLLANVHVENIGWMESTEETSEWFADGECAGTTGQALRMEAVQFALAGDAADSYDVYYRAHVQDYGWLGWACNGEIAGSTGLAKRVEAVQILIIEKGSRPSSDAYGIQSLYDSPCMPS